MIRDEENPPLLASSFISSSHLLFSTWSLMRFHGAFVTTCPSFLFEPVLVASDSVPFLLHHKLPPIPSILLQIQLEAWLRPCTWYVTTLSAVRKRPIGHTGPFLGAESGWRCRESSVTNTLSPQLQMAVLVIQTWLFRVYPLYRFEWASTPLMSSQWGSKYGAMLECARTLGYHHHSPW